ncbi:MAG: hypothetical protein AAF928_20280, partial [Myxococcota bacterium]
RERRPLLQSIHCVLRVSTTPQRPSCSGAASLASCTKRAGVQTLSRPSPEVPGPVDDRVVHVFLGADGAFAEADGGASYRLRHLADASSSAALSFELEGASLPSCGDAPCVAEGDTIRLPGAGVLSMRQGGSEVATLTVVGAPASVTVVVHRP